MRSVFLACILLICSVCAFAQEKYLYISEISISGNEKTKPQTILREFGYSAGDSISGSDIDNEMQAFADNLRRLMLFNDVDVSYSATGSQLSIDVNVNERWYYWVYPILEIADRNLTSYFYYKDFGKINYGAAFDWLNFRGRNEMLNFKVRLGYKEHYAVSYQKPNIGKRRWNGIWLKAEYFRQRKDIAYISECKPVYADDDRYIRSIVDAGVGYVFRPHVNYEFSLSLTYLNVSSRDSLLLAYAPEKQNYMVPAFSFDYDNRDSKVAPTLGLHVNLGAKVFADFDANAFAYVTLEMEYNTGIYQDRLLYHGTLLHRQFLGDYASVPANMRIEMCRGNLIRGFDYYYIIARNFSALQNTLSVKLLDRCDFSLPDWIPRKFREPYIQIYADIFADLAYCSNFAAGFNGENPLLHKPIYSAGAGLSFETYYDRVLKVYAAYNGNFNFFGVFVDYVTPIYKKF